MCQGQHPEIFGEPSVVTVGAQHIETKWTEASGKWSDAGDKFGTNSTHIECYEKFGFCFEAEAYFLFCKPSSCRVSEDDATTRL